MLTLRQNVALAIAPGTTVRYGFSAARNTDELPMHAIKSTIPAPSSRFLSRFTHSLAAIGRFFAPLFPWFSPRGTMIISAATIVGGHAPAQYTAQHLGHIVDASRMSASVRSSDGTLFGHDTYTPETPAVAAANRYRHVTRQVDSAVASNNHDMLEILVGSYRPEIQRLVHERTRTSTPTAATATMLEMLAWYNVTPTINIASTAALVTLGAEPAVAWARAA